MKELEDEMKNHQKALKIAFIYFSLQSFVKRDLEILQKHFEVISIQWRGKRDLLKIAKGVMKSDLIFSWFAEDHAAVAVFFSKIFRKKSVVVVGGGDVAYVPEIGYGRFTQNWFKKMLTKFALKNADLLLPVSEFTKNEILKKIKPKGKIIVVYNGVDNKKFIYLPNNKENIVLTVGVVIQNNLKRKGLENFVRVAKYLPDAKFVLVGKWMDNSINYLRSIATPNVEFTGYLSEEKLIKMYQKAKVVCQLSYYEAFGLAPAEGMACGCIPVATDRGALPEVVEDCGFYVPYGDEKATAEAIKKALNAPDELGKKARERIKNMFPIERREKELIEIIDSLVGGSIHEKIRN